MKKLLSKTWPVLVVLGLLLGLVPVVAAAGSTLYTHPGSESIGYGSSTFWDFETADDFVVPAGETWTLDSIFAKASAGSASTAHVVFYTDSGGLPGVVACSYSDLAAVTGGGGITMALSSPCTLNSGTYWVSVQASNGTQWWWAMTETIEGNMAALDWASICSRWSPVTCRNGLTIDALFTLYGDSRPAYAPFVGTFDVSLTGGAAEVADGPLVNEAAPSDDLIVSFTVHNNSLEYYTYGLALLANFPDGLEVTNVWIALGNGAVVPYVGGGDYWTLLQNIPQDSEAVVGYNVTVADDASGPQCVLGSVVKEVFGFCINVGD